MLSANCGKVLMVGFGQHMIPTDSLPKTGPDLAQPNVILNLDWPAGFQKAAEPASVTSEQRESY